MWNAYALESVSRSHKHSTVMCQDIIINTFMVATSFTHFSKIFTVDLFVCPNKSALTIIHPPTHTHYFYLIFFVLSPSDNATTNKHWDLVFEKTKKLICILQNICSFYSFCSRDVWSNWRQTLRLTLFVWAVISTHTWGWEACALAPTALSLRAKHEANVETQTDQQRAPHLGRSDALQNKVLRSALWSLI